METRTRFTRILHKSNCCSCDVVVAMPACHAVRAGSIPALRIVAPVEQSGVLAVLSRPRSRVQIPFGALFVTHEMILGDHGGCNPLALVARQVRFLPHALSRVGRCPAEVHTLGRRSSTLSTRDFPSHLAASTNRQSQPSQKRHSPGSNPGAATSRSKNCAAASGLRASGNSPGEIAHRAGATHDDAPP